jgi:hypothetical protein
MAFGEMMAKKRMAKGQGKRARKPKLLKNLLAWSCRLTDQELETIAYAMRVYGPKDNLLSGYDNHHKAVTECQPFFFLDRKVVITALLKAEAHRLSRLAMLLVPIPIGAFVTLANKLKGPVPRKPRRTQRKR